MKIVDFSCHMIGLFFRAGRMPFSYQRFRTPDTSKYSWRGTGLSITQLKELKLRLAQAAPGPSNLRSVPRRTFPPNQPRTHKHFNRFAVGNWMANLCKSWWVLMFTTKATFTRSLKARSYKEFVPRCMSTEKAGARIFMKESSGRRALPFA